MKIYCITFFIFLLTVLQVSAQQLHLQAISGYNRQATYAGRTESASCPSDTVRLKLPFFDDFSTSLRGVADTAKWLCGSGVYVNNSLPIKHLSVGVASFDGLNSQGTPYNFATPTATGGTDTLTSRPIDLTEVNLNNVLLSFYLQPAGNGERPDKGDFFSIEFKDDKNRWVSAVTYEAEDQWIDFKYQVIRLDIVGGGNYNFFHKNFQFRFFAQGRLSGMYDNWNIDYIYLGKDRNPAENFFDMAIAKQPAYFLREYTAMPLTHFNTKHNRFDTLKASMNNLADKINALTYKVIIKDGITKDTFGTAMDTIIAVPSKARDLFLFGLMKRVKMPSKINKKTHLQVELQMKTNENLDYGFRTTTNDTVASTVVLDNYYAYDDGSAEYGISFNQKFGRIAYEFEATKDDKLYSIDVMFLPLGFNIIGETFNLHIVKKLNIGGGSNKDSTLLVQNFFVSYPDSINQLKRLILGRPVDITAGKFYIVIEQLSDKNLVIGFDKNNDRSQNIYVNVTNKWEQDKFIKGSLLIRPVFGSTITGIEEDNFAENNYHIYPNPTNKDIFIDGEVEQITVVDALGQKLIEQKFEIGTDKTLSLQHLANGMYFLYLQNKGKIQVKKVVVLK
jgi:hypothetical protein